MIYTNSKTTFRQCSSFWAKICTALFAMCMFVPTVNAQTRGTLPPPQSDHDPIPPAPKITRGESPGITEQAGVGGSQGYARLGVLELGGSMGFTKAEDLTEFSFSPSIGWFIVDNVQLTAILSWNYVKATGDGSHVMSAMMEPSFYLPIDNSRFVFAGIGAGIQYMSQPESEVGFALAPRAGFKHLLGRSGLISLDVRPIFSFNETIQTPHGTVLGVENLWSINAGYTILW